MGGLLFDIGPRYEWERGRVDRWGKAHEHRYGDWLVEHCGHPTANYPWAIISPEGRAVLAPNGHAWRSLAEAKAEVEKRAKGGAQGRGQE